ncbi:MAG: phosphomannomutase/phosphoglucomutase [Pseudomonadota bacterium]
MAKNKKVDAPAPAEARPAKKKLRPRPRGGARTLLRDVLPGAVLLAGALIALQVAIYYLLGQTGAAQREELAQAYRQHYVAMLDGYLLNHQPSVKALPDAELLTYLAATPDSDKGLRQRFPGAYFARVVPLNLDPALPNGLTFAIQDMVLRVAAGKTVRPEISFFESGSVKEHVATFSRLLKNDAGKPAGVLLVGFPFKPTADALGKFAPEAGRFELLQKIGNEQATIIEGGAGGEGAGVEVGTSNPGWRLRFTPAADLGSKGSQASKTMLLRAATPALAMAIFFWVVLSLQRKLKQDLDAIDNFSDNFFHYGHRQRPALHFQFSMSLLDHLERYGAELRAGRGAMKQPRVEREDELGELDVSDDTSLFGAASAPASSEALPEPTAAGPLLRPEIFRAYDIRGVVGDGLGADVARVLGLAIGSEAQARGESTVLVGRDGRLSGPELSAALIEGLRASGRDVIDVGMVPTPVLYFAAKTIGSGSGVMVTGSHNPADYNGFKIMLAGDTLAGDAIQALRERIEKNDFTSGEGGLTQVNVAQDYVDRVSGDIALARPLHVVVDGGNGVAGPIGVRTLEAIGCTVTQLYCEVDGTFPNHHPDPSKPKNLVDLVAAVAARGADIGIAFDGDGDRIGVVTSSGKNIFPDRLMMLYAKHVLTTNPGADIIFDVKCTRDLPALISRLGGRPVMCKTGHSFIKARLKETGAALAGEMSGHIFFNDRWFGFDDALYSAARLLEILSLENVSSDRMFEEFPENPSTPEINIAVPDERKFALMERLRSQASFPDANVITIDGVRVEFAEGWGLVRASNTTPCLVARFEGRTPEALAEVQARFRELLARVDATLDVSF